MLKKVLSVIISFLLIFSFVVSIPENVNAITIGEVSNNRYEFNGHIYKEFNFILTWYQAKSYCESIGGHLMTITSKEEQEFIQTLPLNSMKNYWLGATDEKEEGNWEWITGEEWLFTQWANNQPDNTQQNTGIDEDYLQLCVEWGRSWNDSANTQDSTAQVGFICEWDDPHIINSDYDNTRYFYFNENEEIEDLVYSKPSSEYNPRLAHFLACMARSAYTSDLVKDNYRELGFGEPEQHHYDEGDFFAGFNIGKKDLGDGSLFVLINIRGTSDDNERNFTDFNTELRESDLSPSVGVHSGFENSEIMLYNYLKEYLGGTIPKQNVTYVITGHSLGGAVGNLLAMRLNNDGVSNQDVYDYNYASPLVAAGSEDVSVWNDKGVHNNIINVNNWFDYVPSWPGLNNYSQVQYDDYEKKGWKNFKRFGVSYWFDNGFMNFGDAHNICSYIDYLEKLNDKSHFRDTEYVIDIVSAHCPVDVVIYDKKGNPIAGTINNEPNYYSYEPGEKAVILVNGDKKDFYILINEPFEVRLTGTDEGEMEYVISTVNATKEETISVKWFVSVPLTAGKEMLGKTVNVRDEDSKTITQDEKLLLVDGQGGMNTQILEKGEETEYTVKYILGDADGDGDIASIDATYLLRFNAEIKTSIGEDVLQNGDADGNGELEIVDATYIQRWLAEFSVPYLIGADVV